jgi:hypothetical protein
MGVRGYGQPSKSEESVTSGWKPHNTVRLLRRAFAAWFARSRASVTCLYLTRMEGRDGEHTKPTSRIAHRRQQHMNILAPR